MLARRAFLLMPLALAASELVACAATPTLTTRQAEPMPGSENLRIGVLPITDTVPFYVAQESGYFAEEGLAVQMVPVSSAAERDQLMTVGEIDGQVSDLVATALFNAGGSQLRIVRKARQAFPDSPQFSILAAPGSGITSVEDLKGVEIAVSQNSVIQYVTERLLEKEGLAGEDVRTVSVPQIPVRMQLLAEGQVKAATLPDPLSNLAVLEGATVVIDDSSHPEVSQSVIAFRAEVIEQRPEDVRRFLAAYERALAAIREDPARFQNLLVEKGRVPEALKDKYAFPRLPEAEVPSREQWEDVIEWLTSKGLLEKPVSYEDAVDDSFLK